jgi:1-acyl-sn-glycerol-3-phosphate acyltransferase
VVTAADLPEGASPWLHDLGRWVAGWLYRPAYRISVVGRERVPRFGPVVLVANHSSLIEAPVIFGMLPRRSTFLVKKELSTGVLGKALRRIGQVSVDRGAADRTALSTAVRLLADGGLVGVFPEGTRGPGDVARAEQGAAWLVRMSGAVVLPVATRGTHRPADVRRRFRPKLDVLVGEPFELTVPRGRSGLAEATETIRRRLADLVRELDEQRAAAV